MSMSGDRPPCTQSTAPVSLPLLPFAEDVAPVPAAPVRDGVGAIGEDDAGFEFELRWDCAERED